MGFIDWGELSYFTAKREHLKEDIKCCVACEATDVSEWKLCKKHEKLFEELAKSTPLTSGNSVTGFHI